MFGKVALSIVTPELKVYLSFPVWAKIMIKNCINHKIFNLRSIMAPVLNLLRQGNKILGGIRKIFVA